MKRLSTLVRYIIMCATVTLPLISFGQYNPGLPANFGVDGDLLSGQSQNISGGTPQGSFDWFKKPGSGSNTGLGLIDTTGTGSIASEIAKGQNKTFNKGLAFSRYSTQNGYLLIDARYSRDNFGYSNASGQSDSTTFTSGSKNGDDPSTWVTATGGATVANKADIIDGYITMLRDGTIINNTNPSHLILAMGVSTVGNTGNRYIDFELFRSRIAYNSATGVFSNSGTSTSGGHTAWAFYANGTVKDIGDLSASFTYGTSGVSEISLYIWISKVSYTNTTPANFKFVPGEFYGSTYGYAKIVPVSNYIFQAWGSAASAITNATPWGTNSSSLGSSPGNYYSANYDANNFGEVGIDLTSLGVDPALSIGMDPCSPPYTRVMIKSRSSANFNSALQDFSGPYLFLDAPQASPQIATAAVLKCNVSTVTLSPATPVSGASYQWTTSNGNILTEPDATSITVNKTGVYYLTSAVIAGCPTRMDSTKVAADYYKPVASASVTGILMAGVPTSTVTLTGGNVTVSNYNTPFGGSAGLAWNWSGPDGFTDTAQNPLTNLEGDYTLVVTELRNGCTDTAVTTITAFRLLAVKYMAFDAVAVDNGTVNLTWTTQNQTNNDHFEIERSFDEQDFQMVGIIFNAEGNSTASNSYRFKDNSSALSGHQVAYYRLKQVDVNGNFTYSTVKLVRFNLLISSNNTLVHVYPNPYMDKIKMNFNSDKSSTAVVRMMNLKGQIIVSQQTLVLQGNNNIQLTDLSSQLPGLYFINVVINGKVLFTQKVMKN